MDRVTQINAVPFWWHSIDVGDGVVTEGHKSPGLLQDEWDAMRVPDLAGKTVLDIGAWDGFFSFQAERAGAARVVALDHYVWSLDLGRQQRYWAECRERGVSPEPYETVPGLWQPESLPGKQGFDTAHRLRGSNVESVVDDFMTTDLDALGRFDVVFYLGVLYHMRDPLEALSRVRRVTGELAVIETEAIVTSHDGDHALVEFFESNELNGDVSNWWSPSVRALEGMCRAAGFARAEVFAPEREMPVQGVERLRVVAHAVT